MATVIKAILEPEVRARIGACDYARDIGKVASGGLFAKDVPPCFKPKDCRIRSHIVRQADEEEVEALIPDHQAKIAVLSHAGFEHAFASKNAIRNGDCSHPRMLVNKVPPPFANNAVACDSNPQAALVLSVHAGFAVTGVR